MTPLVLAVTIEFLNGVCFKFCQGGWREGHYDVERKGCFCGDLIPIERVIARPISLPSRVPRAKTATIGTPPVTDSGSGD